MQQVEVRWCRSVPWVSRKSSRRCPVVASRRRLMRRSCRASNTELASDVDRGTRAEWVDSKPGRNGSGVASDYGLILSPGGFLVSYYLGVLQRLLELRLIHDRTPIAGTSAGALAAAFMVSGLSLSDCVDITKAIQSQLVKSGYGWRVIDILKGSLQDVLPDDVHLRATDRIGIGLTVYTKDRRVTGKILTEFETKNTFVDAVAASCYIPFYLGPRLGIKWPNGDVYSDGMPQHFFPETSMDTAMYRDQTLTISAFPAANRRLFDKRDVDISPDRRHPSDIPSVWKVLWNGLVPLKTQEVEAYRQKGYADTLLWERQTAQHLPLQFDQNPSL